jgi:hypothetical protein
MKGFFAFRCTMTGQLKDIDERKNIHEKC